MALPSDPTMLRTSFFHAGGQRSFHRDGQQIYESYFPSLGVIWAEQVKVPSVPLPLNTISQAQVDAWITTNPGILRKYNMWPLTPDPVSNNQTYYIVDVPNGGVQKPIVQEQLLTDPATAQPSGGFAVLLFQGVGGATPGAPISPTAGRWFVSPDEGFVHFEVGFTPVDMGWGIPEIICYVYIGDTLEDIVTPGSTGGGYCAPLVSVGQGPSSKTSRFMVINPGCPAYTPIYTDRNTTTPCPIMFSGDAGYLRSDGTRFQYDEAINLFVMRNAIGGHMMHLEKVQNFSWVSSNQFLIDVPLQHTDRLVLYSRGEDILPEVVYSQDSDGDLDIDFTRCPDL